MAEQGVCPFHGPECWYECGMDTAMEERAAGDPTRLEKDRVKNNELAKKYPHLYKHKEDK